MPTLNLSDVLIRKAIPPEVGRSELWDSHIKGLCLRITPNGTKTWTLRYRVKGMQRRFVLGNYPGLVLAKARKNAGDMLAEIKLGKDPQAEKEENRIEDKPVFLGEAIERYLKSVKRTLRTSAYYNAEWAMKKHLKPEIGRKALENINKRHLLALFEKRVNSGMNGNSLFRQIRAFFNWCLSKDLITTNPMAGIKQPGPVISRDRVLNENEIKVYWKATKELDYPWAEYFQLLLLTGQRRGEVAQMRWKDIDHEKGIWTIPAEVAKNDKPHDVPLAPKAEEIIQEIPSQKSDFLLTTNLTAPISGFSKAKKRLDGAIQNILEKNGEENIPEWRVHDIRRTVATQLAGLGTAIHVLEKLLNHTSGTISGVAAIYNRHEYFDERKRALEAWESRLGQIIEKDKKTNVVSIREQS